MDLESYMGIIGITVLALIGYISIVFMLSYALKRPQLEAYAKIELSQLFLSAIILVIAFAAWNFADMASTALAGGNPIDISIEFLNIVINEGILPIYLKLVRMEVLLTYFNAVEYRMGPGPWNWITKAVPGLDPLISIVRMLVFSFTALYGTMSVQVILFYLIDAVAYYYLLPAGIILRFFPPTRDAGVYLIVLAIAFQCFFPLLYSINYIALSDMWQLHGWADSYTPNIEETNYFNSMDDALGVATSTTDTYFSSWFLPIFQPLSFMALVPFMDRISQISLVGLFLPALTMTLTIAFVNAVTKFITGKG
ncbi:hypothetical protein GF412_04455 [Candidatus Micrarchaeota archaeon]|nr:hypothetical protein [Candidatus Micrarchaeota archaeon]MBD3418203.1 hypothetical protein [Candidatus Micrarchaeota archaeon]